jgi:glycerate 2-kinase
MPMQRTAAQLRDDALRIWRAGVDAVRSDRLVIETLRVEGDTLWIGDETIDLGGVRRIVVVGAGKAGAGMAAGVEQALGADLMRQKQLTGWVNVPADCVRTLTRITLHPARPAGVNEPTEAGVRGSAEVLRLVESLGPADLCLCLLSGGGSALLPAPIEGITLADKQAVTRHLSGAGANIQELNTVRKQLSRIKGGGLARACRAGRLVTLIISDVLGDPLDVIASGPTVPNSATAADALGVLERFHAREAGIAPAVFELLASGGRQPPGNETHGPPSLAEFHGQASLPMPPDKIPHCSVRNLVIGNNALAVDAAGIEAERLGYSAALVSATKLEGQAEDIGRHLAEMALRMRSQPGPDCLISGGEPVVRLAPADERGLGGRNQQLVLAALEHLADDGATGIALLSGGTDGEDGPTDAAGALLDQALLADARRRGLDIADFLRRNDAYHFFDPLDGLIRTGPTHTNVCDVRVVVVAR